MVLRPKHQQGHATDQALPAQALLAWPHARPARRGRHGAADKAPAVGAADKLRLLAFQAHASVLPLLLPPAAAAAHLGSSLPRWWCRCTAFGPPAAKTWPMSAAVAAT